MWLSVGSVFLFFVSIEGTPRLQLNRSVNKGDLSQAVFFCESFCCPDGRSRCLLGDSHCLLTGGSLAFVFQMIGWPNGWLNDRRLSGPLRTRLDTTDMISLGKLVTSGDWVVLGRPIPGVTPAGTVSHVTPAGIWFFP